MSLERENLPRAEEAEEALLGAFMRSGALVKASKISREDFYSERNRSIFQAMQSLASDDQDVNIHSLGDRMRREGTYFLTNGGTVLMDIADACVSSVGWDSWEEVILEKSIKRAAIAAARRLNASAVDDTMSSADVVAEYAKTMDSLVKRGTSPVIMFSTAWDDAMSPVGKAQMLTRVEWLDDKVKIRPGQLGIIAGRPGEGKTALATQIATGLAVDGEVMFVSLEMGPDEVTQRIISQVCEIDLRMFDDPDPKATMGREAYSKARACQSGINLSFCEGSTVQEIRAVALARKAYGKLRAIVVDYLQLMTVRSSQGNRTQDVAEISRGLKLLARELQIPVIALSQFSREAAKGPPQLHHLRESGSIEQDADWILFVYTPQQEFGDNKERVIEVPKQRRGPRHGAFSVGWHGPTVSFLAEFPKVRAPE
jgi:replicative DNA helicase